MGYVVGRSGGSLYSRVLPEIRLGADEAVWLIDLAGQTLDGVLSDVDKMTTNRATDTSAGVCASIHPNNPASSTGGSRFTLYWYDGWHRQVIDRLARSGSTAAGRVRR